MIASATLVYVLDDDPAVGAALQRLLRSAGHRAVAVSTLPQLRAALELAKPSCVIVDLMMPDAAAVHRLLREAGASIRVIYVSTQMTELQRARLMARGAYRCLEKPLDADELLEAIAGTSESAPQLSLALSLRRSAVPGVGIEPT